jgi:predicted transcriptional regulator
MAAGGEGMGKGKDVLACGQSLKESIDIQFYKTLFDPVRSDILICLASRGRMNIKEVAGNFPQDRSMISKHLSLMHRYGIVLKEKHAREIFYEINGALIVEKFEKTAISLKRLLAKAGAGSGG